MGGAADGVRLDGETQAEMFERFGKGEEVPETPDFPACFDHVVGWFFDLSRRRAPAMSGVSPIQFGDIADWRDLLGIDIAPEEVKLILALDDAYRTAVSEQQAERKPSQQSPPKGSLKA